MADPGTLVVQLPGLGRSFRLDEWVHGRLFSAVNYTTGQAATIDAFSYIRGQTLPDTGGTSDERHTNMPEAGRLPNGWEALIFSHQIAPPNDIDDADYRDIDTKAVYVLRVGRSAVYESHLRKLPGGGGMSIVSSNNATEQVQNGPPSPRDQAAFLIPVHVRENKNFAVENRFPATLSLGSARIVHHYLEGLIKRPIDVG
jgi:hypothetical protein